MSFLVTADIQCEWSNLDLCERAWNEVLHICRKRRLKTIVFCGDGKEAYDPVSIRVIKFWEWTIRKANKRGVRVIYLRGNHDRIATYTEVGDWLSILKRAGAITFSSPGVIRDGDRRLFMLPYAKVKTVKRWSKELLKHNPDKTRDVLFFHANLLEARYSQHGKRSDSTLRCDDLFNSKYRFVVGGDIHFPQRMGEKRNVYYVGSPFCFDWGEVNQRKRYLVVGKHDIRSIHSNIPRWYDTGVRGFAEAKPRDWNGARIRISVSCDAGENYERKLEKIRAKSQRKYPGAELYIVPKFDEGEGDQQSIKSSDSDERKIEEYIAGARPPKVVGKELALKYMLEKLSYFSHGLRTGSRFKFKWAKARNYLCFEKVYFDFRQKGIVVVRGVNQDRGNKSNGSGKTSLTNLIPVAWFGKTFKGQSHDRWSNRFHSKDQATVEVCGSDVKHREVRVIRGRRPTELKLLVDGRNESAGMKSTDATGTQAHVEQVTGFTWDTLANAVYIDRAISDAFLSGTKAQRTEVLSRFQNLERFAKALKLVKKDAKKNQEKRIKTSEKLERVRGQIEECTHSIEELKEVRKVHVDSMYDTYRQHKRNYKRWKENQKPRRDKLEAKAKKVEDKYNGYLVLQTSMEKRVSQLEEAWQTAKAWAKRFLKLKGKDQCPYCYQPVNRDWMREHKHKVEKVLVKAKHELSAAEKRLTKAKIKTQMLEGEHDELQSKLTHIDEDGSHLRLNVQNSRTQHRELASSQHTSYTIIRKTQSKLKHLEHKKSKLKIRKEQLRCKGVLHEYAMEAFSRDGIPAFINRQLCPALNRASDYYSELFSDKEIQVRFQVEGGEFVPQIINAKGGEHIKDQSEGERALAGLISSFALREAAPETNLLILDEPGNGLDPQTAKQFAKSLKVLNKRFPLIIVTTHNEHISSALEGERVITVRKHNGISKVEVA